MEFEKGKPLNECYGILYDKNNNEIYKGLLKEEKPEKAKPVTIYYDSENLKYILEIFLILNIMEKGNYIIKIIIIKKRKYILMEFLEWINL